MEVQLIGKLTGMMRHIKQWLRSVNWHVVMRVPVYYYIIAWIAWVVAYLSRRRKPVVVRPVIITLDNDGRREASRWLRFEMERAGYSAWAADEIGMYWTRDADDQDGD